MRQLLYILIILLIACNTKKSEANKHLQSAIEHYHNENHQLASKEIESAKKLDSTDLEIKFWDSNIKNGSKLYTQSINILKDLLKKNYKIDTCYDLISTNYFEIGHDEESQKNNESVVNTAYETAVKYCDSAIIKNNLFFSAYGKKVRALHNLGKINDALVTINNALTLFPDSLTLIFLRGVEKDQLGDESGALLDLNKVIESNKLDSFNLAEAYRFRGLIYRDKDSTDKAIIDLTKSIDLYPKYERCYYERALLFKAKNNKEKACADYRKAADLGMTSVYEEIKKYCN